ncbi:MAG: hypothetical protein ACI4C4_01460 [Lachnospiraceae bacterium]
MESMISIIKLIYKDVSSKKILDGTIEYSCFSKEEFLGLCGQKTENLSGNDVEQLFYYLTSQLSCQRNTEWNPNEDSFSVLDALKLYVNRVLEQVKGEPVCKYNRLLAWRMISSQMEEDTFTTAYLACQDLEKPWSKRIQFNWRNVIGHDNFELNNLLKKGVAENHFHLKGSAPYFAITWINLMNKVCNKSFIKYLQQFDSHRLINGIYASLDSYEPSYVVLHLQAALIRCFLYSRLTNLSFDVFSTYRFSQKELQLYVDWAKAGESIKCEFLETTFDDFETKGICKISYSALLKSVSKQMGKEKMNSFWSSLSTIVSPKYMLEIASLRNKIAGYKEISLKTLTFLFLEGLVCVHVSIEAYDELIQAEIRDDLRKQKEYTEVQRYLQTPEMIYEIRHDLQEYINSIKMLTKSNYAYDYIDNGMKQEDSSVLNIYQTERWFLYTMFLRLYGEDKNILPLGNLFYAYLVIKERIHSELVQVNNKAGFDNFLQYQDRKEYFIDNTEFEKRYAQIALQDTWRYQRDFLVKLEARIVPKGTAQENYRLIRNLEEAFGKEDIYKDRSHTFYVFHFIKERDTELCSGKQQCRHYKKRQEIKKKAIAIEKFRQLYPKEASKLVGIDAASPEIGCRPEVFSQAFTFLRGMETVADRYADEVPRLGITYHVGEDFLDIVDGMRAIDEAIHFLQLDSGDRLGHALALGVDPIEWYRFKGNRVCISKQDYLDNVVWIYMKIRKYHIKHSESILQELLRTYIHLMREVYIGEEDLDINEYYDAWKLRGDNPDIYLLEEREQNCVKSEWDYFAHNKCFAENEQVRKLKKCQKIYIRYHYDDDVKRNGSEVVECKISHELMEIIVQIQKCLQRQVAKMGISIETNPSSNYMIGTFRRYDKHPIRNFYNKGLTIDPEELSRNPQIDVTINTDDQAIFSTSLDNEYAYLALALEKMKNQDGEYVYKRSMIYDWLDNIRQISEKVFFHQTDRKKENNIQEEE